MEDLINKVHKADSINFLKNIEDEISVAASTISKKLKESNSCICQSRGTEFYFFIQLVNL